MGWPSIRQFASEGVPYGLYLHERDFGGAFRQVLDATSTLRGNLVEDAVEELFLTCCGECWNVGRQRRWNCERQGPPVRQPSRGNEPLHAVRRDAEQVGGLRIGEQESIHPTIVGHDQPTVYFRAGLQRPATCKRDRFQFRVPGRKPRRSVRHRVRQPRSAINKWPASTSDKSTTITRDRGQRHTYRRSGPLDSPDSRVLSL